MSITNEEQIRRIKIVFILLLVILGVLFLPIITGIILLICSFISNGKKRYWLLLMFCILSGLVFLDIVPGNGLDIERYMIVTSQMSMVSGIKDWLLFCKSNPSTQYEKTSYLFFLLQYIASRFSHLNLLSYYSTVLTSFFYFFPFINYTMSDGLRVKWYACVLSLVSFFLLGYGNIASTMRWGLAVSSCFFVDYLYFYHLKNKRYILLLFLPVFFHLGIILAVILSVYVAILKRINIVTLFVPVIIVIIYMELAVRGDSSSIIGQLSNMTAIYSNGFGSGQVISQGAKMVMLVQYITVFMLIFYYINLQIKSKVVNEHFSNLAKVFIIMLIFLIPKSTIFYRYATFAVIIYCFIAVQILKRRKSTFNELILLLLVVACSSFLGFVSYRQFQFVFSDVGIIFKNIFTLLLNAPM